MTINEKTVAKVASSGCAGDALNRDMGEAQAEWGRLIAVGCWKRQIVTQAFVINFPLDNATATFWVPRSQSVPLGLEKTQPKAARIRLLVLRT